MRSLVKVQPHPAFRLVCARCEHRGVSTDDKGWHADTKGEPFVDYYCHVCAVIVKGEDDDDVREG